MKYIIYVFVFFTFLLPGFVSAQIIFSEIMYNPPGADTGREWIEIFNSGTESVDVTNYKLFENSVNHKITAYSGVKILAGGQYAIIADNPEKFLADHNLDIIIFDSAFSLNNTGEELKLINSAGIVTDTVNYSVEFGGNDTGNSLQLNNSVWIPAVPTPGAINATEPVDENSVEPDEKSDDSNTDGNNITDPGSGSTHTDQTDVTNYKPTLKLKASAGRERFVSTNTKFHLEIVHNQDKDSGIRGRWSMGDGMEIKGRKISYIYDRAGEYEIVLKASYEGDEAISRTKIHISDPEIKFSLLDSGKGVDLLLKNIGNKELNIGDYRIENRNKKFVFATDTILGAGKTLTLSENTTGLVHNSEIMVYFPNNDELKMF